MQPDNIDSALDQQRKDEAEWLEEHPDVPVVDVPALTPDAE